MTVLRLFPHVALTAALPLLAMTACAPVAPDDAAGVGFNDYAGYMAQNTGRAAPQGSYGAQAGLVQNGGPQGTMQGTLPGAAAAATGAGMTGTGMTGAGGDIGTATLQALGRAPSGTAVGQPMGQPMGQPLPAPGAGVSPQLEVTAAPSAAAAAPVIDNGGISSENDFSAVSSERSIEADRARIQQNAATYQQIAPTALPQRAGNGPNIVEYAVNARNALGEQVYPRSSLHLSSVQRNCGRFASQDLAQIEFLNRGGPERDPGNLDPDGDGYACLWDPRPFQKK
ncbi:hypothetical protein [Frigidibacter sp. MR17.24]|uniref:hypothetical protein n=1 Tax=Frigidibacter sp. MR17.24 TaxID=3127345 RepID=UPI0030131CB2